MLPAAASKIDSRICGISSSPDSVLPGDNLSVSRVGGSPVGRTLTARMAGEGLPQEIEDLHQQVGHIQFIGMEGIAERCLMMEFAVPGG